MPPGVSLTLELQVPTLASLTLELQVPTLQEVLYLI